MPNETPIAPDIACPITPVVASGYYTEEQSHLNVARNDKFMLIMDVPCILKPFLKKENRWCHGGNIDKLQLTIWGYEVPEVSVETIEVPYAGQVIKVSSLARPAYPPCNVNFTVDNRYDNYYLLWKWIDIQNNAESGTFDRGNLLNDRGTGRLPEYSTTITIIALDEYDKEVAAWDHSNAFVSKLGSIKANSRTPNELESTFSFDFSQLKMRLL